jgi:hypothetical protein
VLLTEPPDRPRRSSAPARTQVDRRLRTIEEWLERGRNWLTVIIPLYVALRVLAFSGFDPAVTLEVVRTQGLTGIAGAAVLSVVNEIFEFLYLAALVGASFA